MNDDTFYDETWPPQETLTEKSAGHKPTAKPQDLAPPVEIPADIISPEALLGIIESFVLREGTDYGPTEVSHEAKTAQVRRQIDNGEIKIVFDPESESVTLMPMQQWKRQVLAE